MNLIGCNIFLQLGSITQMLPQKLVRSIEIDLLEGYYGIGLIKGAPVGNLQIWVNFRHGFPYISPTKKTIH